ncbi:hypothetical protein D9M70_607280 [compost metagenome]
MVRYPTMVKTRISLELTLRENSPFSFEKVPFVWFLTEMVTPGSPSPLSSVTFPVILFSWAKAAWISRREKSRDRKLFPTLPPLMTG